MRNLSRRSLLLSTLSLTLLSLNWANSATAEETPLKAGDRVVFLGDSITQAGVGPLGYVTLIKKDVNEKFGEHKVYMHGAGISGNKVPDLEKRLEKDVLGEKPTIVVIYIGINDVWHSKNGKGTPKDEFEAGLRRIIKHINDAGARVILTTPSVIGEKTNEGNPLDEMLGIYCEISRKVAKDTKSQLLDLRKQFVEYLKVKNKFDDEKGVLTTDGVHLNDKGNRFVADRMLEALGATAAAPAAATAGKKLRHFVIFKFKDDAKPEQVKEVVDAFSALPGKINEIIDFETGTDVSVEMKSEGFTHAFLVTFANEKGREIYLPHPAHQEFVKLVGPVIDKVLVFDYWTK
ncbi:MAG: Stress responsive alpha-beta barrel domain protein [Planctomycetaceae bacterium]|nr:Stress responsive alpha-beta barrel domain protein [Planctomycetaceae bacterium]